MSIYHTTELWGWTLDLSAFDVHVIKEDKFDFEMIPVLISDKFVPVKLDNWCWLTIESKDLWLWAWGWESVVDGSGFIWIWTMVAKNVLNEHQLLLFVISFSFYVWMVSFNHARMFVFSQGQVIVRTSTTRFFIWIIISDVIWLRTYCTMRMTRKFSQVLTIFQRLL